MTLFLTFAFPKEQYVYIPQGPSIEARIDLEGKIEETKLKHQQDLEQQKVQDRRDQQRQQLEDIVIKCIEEKQRHVEELERMKKEDPVGYAAKKMAQNTGVSEAQWRKVIIKESGGNPNAISSSGTYIGLFQIGRPWGAYPGMSIDEQIAMATHVYKVQGPRAWEVWYW